jgi:hypothetical protein
MAYGNRGATQADVRNRANVLEGLRDVDVSSHGRFNELGSLTRVSHRADERQVSTRSSRGWDDHSWAFVSDDRHVGISSLYRADDKDFAVLSGIIG